MNDKIHEWAEDEPMPKDENPQKGIEKAQAEIDAELNREHPNRRNRREEAGED